MDSQLKTLMDKLDQREMEASLQEVTNALRCSLKNKKKVSTNDQFYSQFEKLGSRNFYIERHVKKDWFSAASTCREMGGHLATPKDENELSQIRMKVDAKWYWLDISDLATKDEYISFVSGEKASFLNWHEGEPNNDPSVHCVYLYAGHYYKHLCNERNFFICQAAEETQ
ncbi:accessory gland protein Acp29AB [Drosophila elegans]|uniref:accessory gland protein Acp29AB n=1 Tax=Drosophila elegans TaxID=30023 RepID=UPI0007E5F8C0|nr:accessory gland protein Acp29AB [Drosophila elegans]